MAIVRQLANTLMDRIVMVEDCPSNHKNGMMPVLDLQVWIDPENNKIRWQHYRKPVSNPLLTLKISALPDKIKRCTHAQEGIRIFEKIAPKSFAMGLEGQNI